jgi:hypothetical protein
LAVRDLLFNILAAILHIWHAVRTGKKKNAYKVFVGKPEGKDHQENLDLGGRIVLK